MAKTFSDEEREERIDLVVQHILDTGDSYRETAKYLSNLENFEISHVTVKDYCDRYINSHNTQGHLLKEIIDGNKPKSIEDKNIKDRVLLVSKIYASSDYTIEEIAQNLDISPWTIYYDITVRLPKIETSEAQNLKNITEEKLKIKSFNNLRNQNERHN